MYIECLDGLCPEIEICQYGIGEYDTCILNEEANELYNALNYAVNNVFFDRYDIDGFFKDYRQDYFDDSLKKLAKDFMEKEYIYYLRPELRPKPQCGFGRLIF